MRYSGEIITLRPSGIRVKQVNKTTARKLYNEGKTIYMHSCNMTLNNPWTSPYDININGRYGLANTSFDSMVLDFQYYNCDAERGKYANFFVEVD